MIGIVCFDHEKSLVKEFFELFKTPWEFCRQGKKYEAVLSTGPEIEAVQADLLLIYSSRILNTDTKAGIAGNVQDSGDFEYRKNSVPIYGDLLKFQKRDDSPGNADILLDCVYTTRAHPLPVIRIGYDLFRETGYLLTKGQPAGRALTPTLELHISILRELMAANGIPVVEIPPAPSGYSSITCLTHDVDFMRIADHRFDSTMFGFIYRALFGSVRGILNGRGSPAKLLKNWAAVLALPGVYLGICRDFLNNIERYIELEKGLHSTFFLIPFKNHAGKASGAQGKVARSVKYDIGDMDRELPLMLAAGCEIGLHGIDAWCSREQGERELRRIKQFSQADQAGIRMHWLFFGPDTPETLQQAGFLYDSTMGYNDAIGFKCGTAQVFRFPNADNLSELPLIIQDTALFYPDRMNLREADAEALVKQVIATIEKYGGAATLNWHQRSLGPERNWGDFYQRILRYLKQRKTWFAGCTDAAAWFEKRRSALFGSVELSGNLIRVNVEKTAHDRLPGLKLRVYKPAGNRESRAAFEAAEPEYIDVDLNSGPGIEIQL